MTRMSAVLVAGLLAFVGVAAAQEKKAVAKGTFTMNGTTYKVASAVAYTRTVDDEKETVVILADKPLNAAQLKASLKKSADGSDYDPYPRIELTFDEKGVLVYLGMQTQDAGIKHMPAGHIKDHTASATIADTSVKGSAITNGKEDRESINRHKYRFDVTFDVKLTKP